MARQKGDTETNYEIRSYDATVPVETYRRFPKAPLCIVLDNVRSAFNVGSIFRLCDALRVEELLLCGYTAFPPHIKLDKTSLGTTEYVPWKHFETTMNALDYLQEKKTEIWAAETTSASVAFDELEFPPSLALVFGNEVTGIERAVIDRCEKVVEIPLFGFKNSVNVANACSIMAYTVCRRIASLEPVHHLRG